MTDAPHIVWDWNGTLFSDNDAVVTAVNAVCADYGCEPIDLEHWRSIFTRPLMQSYERLLKRSLDQNDWNRIDTVYHSAYRELLHTCGLSDGAPELLQRWSDHGGTQSLLSMWFHSELVPLVTEFGLDPLFTRIDGLREPNGGASKAANLAEHLKVMGRDGGEVVMIGDVVDDAYAAEMAGVDCVLLTTGVMPRHTLEETGFTVADSIAEAFEVIAPQSVDISTSPAQHS